MAECPYCKDHEHRLERLEEEMQECQTHISKSNVTVAMISTVGVVITAASSFVSYIAVAYCKSRGWF